MSNMIDDSEWNGTLDLSTESAFLTFQNWGAYDTYKSLEIALNPGGIYQNAETNAVYIYNGTELILLQNASEIVAYSAENVNVQGGASDTSYYLVGVGGTSGTQSVSTSDSVYMKGSGLYASSVYQTSDDRSKDYIGDVEIPLSDILRIPLKTFTYKDDESKSIKIGTSAQELQKIAPALVDEGADGALSVDYSKLSIIALNAIHHLNAENAMLKKRLDELTSRLSRLEKLAD